ncbi:serine/threonine-protein kinase [Candidatus Uabimicrobium amorphum]|uniref:Protein kinase n=1 Tax=Uabimicrobium amorphum TaxID=2596890 RepID=A0A5S9F182_UABAM|nr:serine/threonine-protein kinase [Candidatus Uabimicrobium amorphum]BBM82385.1 protein kinase [Candidatus Uabimicrobium amorphum]
MKHDMPNSLCPGQTFAQYRIDSYLGHGAMGVVYKVFDPQRNQYVALKILQMTALGQKHRESFIREVKAIAHLNHKNVVKLYDVGSHPQYYFTMEYVPGRTLAEVIAEENISQNVVGKIFSKLALALYHAHTRNIVHGDIKPRNIIISKNWEPKITDFGLAYKKNAERKESRVQGTPAYLSPEQLKNSKVDKRSDIYALGVTMYRTLTGKLPFDEKNPAALFYQISHSSPAPLRSINTSISPCLQNICLKCLEKCPENRYANGKFLYNDLQSFLYPVWYSHPLLRKCFSAKIAELLLVASVLILAFVYATSKPSVSEVHSIWEFERDKLLRKEYKSRMMYIDQMRLDAHMKNFDRHHEDDSWKNEVIYRWRKQLKIGKNSPPRLLFSFARSILKLKDMFGIANLGSNNIPFAQLCIWGNLQALKANNQELTQKFRVLMAIVRGKKEDDNPLPSHLADTNYYLAMHAVGTQREQYLLRGIACEPLPYLLKELVSFYHAHHLYEKTIHTAEVCLKKYPYDMVVRYYLAINLFYSGNTTKALYHLNIVDKHYYSGHKELLFLQRAQIYMTQSKWKLARQNLQKAQGWINKHHKDKTARATVNSLCKDWLRVLSKIRNNNWNFDLPRKGMEAKFYYSLGKIEKAYALINHVNYASLRFAIYRAMLERQGKKIAKVSPVWRKAYNDVITCAKNSLSPKNNLSIYYEYMYLFLRKCPKNERVIYLKQSANLRQKMQQRLQYHYERYASEAHLAYENGQMAKAVFLWERAIAKAPWCKEHYRKLRDDALAATLNLQKK